VAEPVHAPILKSDPQGADLQTQIHDLSMALQNWRRTREYSQPTEERLAQITVQCARMVDAWQEMERRNGGAVDPSARNGEWGGVESHLQKETAERIRALERTIEHEWEALRDDQDEPVRQLPEPAASAGGDSVAADLTLRGIARTEARLAALEQDFHGRMEQLSRDLHAVVAELRNSRPGLGTAAPAAFPLESVMRIHEELREPEATPGEGPALKPGATRAIPGSTEPATALTARVESLERAVEKAVPPQPTAAWRPLYVVVGLIAALAGMALFGVWMQRRVDTRLNEAAGRVEAAERQRDATMAATREEAARTRDEAARQVAEARQSAAQARIVGDVLAAPDRLRYWLTAADLNAASRAYAQVLFSRSRGVVFSASRLPSAGDGKTYQLWLLTPSGAVSAGLINPDTAGRVTLATEVPSTVQGRVTGALVTLEAAGGGTQPSAERVLVRVE
jgi:hypothetical protein